MTATDADISAAMVRVHIYDLDSISARFLNGRRSWTRRLGLGLFHCGVEVYGWEYCFMYYYDAWETEGLTGVQHHQPTQNGMFEHCDSLDLGRTPLTRAEVRAVMDELRNAWPSNSYHLIGRNCIHFAEELARGLQVTLVPRWVSGLGRTAVNFAPTRWLVNFVWWFMVRAMILTSHELAVPEDFGEASVKHGLPAVLHRALPWSPVLLALVCLPLLGTRLPFLVSGVSPLRSLPLGFLLCLTASVTALLRHRGIVRPVRWLERGSLLALAAWSAARGGGRRQQKPQRLQQLPGIWELGVLLHAAAGPPCCAAAATLCLVWAARLGGCGRRRSWQPAMVLAAQACSAVAAIQIVLLERSQAAGLGVSGSGFPA